jgi:hypothetical protein
MYHAYTGIHPSTLVADTDTSPDDPSKARPSYKVADSLILTQSVSSLTERVAQVSLDQTVVDLYMTAKSLTMKATMAKETGKEKKQSSGVLVHQQQLSCVMHNLGFPVRRNQEMKRSMLHQLFEMANGYVTTATSLSNGRQQQRRQTVTRLLAKVQIVGCCDDNTKMALRKRLLEVVDLTPLLKFFHCRLSVCHTSVQSFHSQHKVRVD